MQSLKEVNIPISLTIIFHLGNLEREKQKIFEVLF